MHDTWFSRVERITRYSLKVKSGEIQPLTPQQKQKRATIIKKKPKPIIEKKTQASRWTLLYKNAANPYRQIYKARVRE